MSLATAYIAFLAGITLAGTYESALALIGFASFILALTVLYFTSSSLKNQDISYFRVGMGIGCLVAGGLFAAFSLCAHFFPSGGFLKLNIMKIIKLIVPLILVILAKVFGFMVSYLTNDKNIKALIDIISNSFIGISLGLTCMFASWAIFGKSETAAGKPIKVEKVTKIVSVISMGVLTLFGFLWLFSPLYMNP
jgi:hypothetical protein